METIKENNPAKTSRGRSLANTYSVRWIRETAYIGSAGACYGAAALAIFVLIVVGGSLSFTFVGIPLLIAGILGSRWLGWLARWHNALWTLEEPHQPQYMAAAPDAEWWRRLWVGLRDPRVWWDMASIAVGSVTGFFGALLVSIWLFAFGAMATVFAWISDADRNDRASVEVLGYTATEGEVFVVMTIVGVVGLLIAPWLTRGVGWIHYVATEFLLNGRDRWLSDVHQLKASRGAARRAQSDAMRQLERNIHDGPQQQLVRLGMDLGRARLAVDNNPDRAKVILDESVTRTNTILDELRNLSRGIAPPVLVDRGLQAAINELASRSTVPVTVHYAASPTVPYYASEVLYFVISESLANVAKHAQASAVTITVQQMMTPTGERCVATISDDGVGGAHWSRGTGLMGLQRRAIAADGTLSVTSPEGVGTTIEVNIPCES